jgi:hypothetical protein
MLNRSVRFDTARLCMGTELIEKLLPPIITAAGAIIAALISKSRKNKRRQQRGRRDCGRSQ